MRSEHQLDSVREAAAAWHNRLQREKFTDATRDEFAAWLAESPEHYTAYAAVDNAWATLQNAALDPQILALRHETALRLTRRTSHAIRPLRWAAAAVILLVLGAGAFTLSSHGVLDFVRMGKPGHYVTATGEHLGLTLNDGSQVTLDTQSELQVNFTATERVVRLLRGQAYFEVAKDHDRPFVVEAQNRRFVAVGTAFDVRVDGEQVKVTMVEGTVRVVSADIRDKASTAAASTANTITAGQQLIADGTLNDQVRPADPERSTSWRRGQIIFDNTRLADAIAEVNRYSESKIELADPALADLRLSGAFATGRPSVFVEAITSYFPVVVTRADGEAIVLSAKM